MMLISYLDNGRGSENRLQEHRQDAKENRKCYGMFVDWGKELVCQEWYNGSA